MSRKRGKQNPRPSRLAPSRTWCSPRRWWFTKPSTRLKTPHPTSIHPTRASAAHRLVRRLAASPKQPQPEGDREPRRRVEEPIGKRVRLEASNRGRRIAPFARQQVMPLQDLVEDDPVHEAAQADAQQQAGEAQSSSPPPFFSRVAEDGEAGLQEVVGRSYGERRYQQATRARRDRTRGDEAERRPRPHTAGTRHQFADCPLQSVAGGRSVGARSLTFDERRADDASQALSRDDAGRLERRSGE